jgi:hypothetical protein
VKARFVFEFLLKPSDEALINFESLDGVADCQKSACEGAEAGTDFLNRLIGGFGQGMGNDGGQSGFGQKVLAELTKRSKAVGGQDFFDPGGVQSWRLRMA